ncbi:MAG: hypothetical protein ACE37F_30620 [Nannocystaceae bacterium]|nr:hypothetical protein [bacterium]
MRNFAGLVVRSALALCVGLTACDGGSNAEESFDEELSPGGELGKADGAGVAALPVDGDYSETEVWEVRNQWEDTDTPAAREAGMAWPADSGLNWDEKYALWVESLETIDGFYNESFEITTPWGKTLEAAKLDCADVALAMRASFAAWYNLPFFITAYDNGTPVHFGHFGIRTADGIWNNMPRFAQFEDFSDLGADALDDWPRDNTLRSRGVQNGDDQDFLGEGSRTGTWLDELHLNKRAGRFIRLMLIFTGSPHLADSRNMFNLEADAIREGDVNLHRWQAQGVGHTMFIIEVDKLEAGKIDARIVEGNLPPAQPRLLDAVTSKLRLVSTHGGGAGFEANNGGLKRFRVAKNMGGFWTNTWMSADEASWINDTDHEAMAARIDTLQGLLGEVSPEEKLAALLDIVEQKRDHLRTKPASCSARTKREEAFAEIYALAAAEFDMTQAEVDAMYRIEDDYIFAELVYSQSKTCCWLGSTEAMYETIIAVNELRQEEAQACIEPLVFKAVDGEYEEFRSHAPGTWAAYSNDENCPQGDLPNHDDVEAAHEGTPYCEWKAGDEGGGDDGGGDDGGGEPDAPSCEQHCGGQSDGCWCDAACEQYGDCCDDYADHCG